MAIFTLTLQQTYFTHGFFNVTIDYDRYVRAQEGPVHLVLVTAEPQTIDGRIDRHANQNGTARIHGGARLRDWFQANFQIMDPVYVDLGLPDLIRLSRREERPVRPD